jgi:hypothetical protein
MDVRGGGAVSDAVCLFPNALLDENLPNRRGTLFIFHISRVYLLCIFKTSLKEENNRRGWCWWV